MPTHLRAALVALLVCLPLEAVAAPLYYAVDLGRFLDARGVNESNVVAGAVTVAPITQHAFRQTDGDLLDLGTLGGSRAEAMGINDAGDVVGWSEVPSGTTGFVFTQGVMHSVDSYYENSICTSESRVNAINDARETTGHCRGIPIASQSHAFVTIDGVMTDLGTLGGSFSNGLAIDALGQVAGLSRTNLLDPTVGGQINHAFVTLDGVMTDLGTLPGDTNSLANALNDLGQVVGKSYSYVGEQYPWTEEGTAFLWEDGVMTDLGLPPGATRTEARGINNLGQVVGLASVPAEGNPGAFYYDDEIGMVNLRTIVVNTQEWVYLGGATDINDQGIIVGTGVYAADQTVAAYMLIPMPEPSASVALAAGCGLLAFLTGLRPTRS